MFISKLFALLLVCISASCENSGSQLADKNQTKEKTELALKLERSGCWNFCPVYQLTIQSNGKVLFEGMQDTSTEGKVESILSKEKIIEIIAEIETADFFSLKDSYTNASDNCPSWAVDSPTVILRVNLNGKEKTITHNLGCREEYKASAAQNIYPQQLYNLENKIDEIVETKRWIGERKY